MPQPTIFHDTLYVTDGKIRRADIVVEGEYIARITDKEEIPCKQPTTTKPSDSIQPATTESSNSSHPASAESSNSSHPASARTSNSSHPASARTSNSSQPASAACSVLGDCVAELLLPGIIDEHVHSREPGLTHKGDLSTESHAAAAGGVTTIMDMPNVVPQTTTLEALAARQALGAAHAFVNYSFYFGATNTNAALLPHLDPATVPAVKLFMGSSTGGMLVDHGDALHAVFEQSPLPIMAHCEDTDVINRNMQWAREYYGDDPAVIHHAEIRSRGACTRSSRLAAELARKYEKHLHIAHVTTAEELSLALLPHRGESLTSLESCAQPLPSLTGGGGGGSITLEACIPHLLFTDEDYAMLGTRIKCNPSVKTRADRDALRAALTDGRITAIATDHAPHLLSEKEGGCRRAASGMPMVQFSLPAMLGLVEEGVLSITRLVELMCHNPARLFGIEGRGFIREGMKADLVLVRRQPWTLTAADVVSRCGWSPLEGRTFPWQVEATYCNGRCIYDHGRFATDNHHAQSLRFNR